MEHWPQEVELEQLLADRSWQDRRWGSFCQVSTPSSVGSVPCAVAVFAAGQDLSKACLCSRVKAPGDHRAVRMAANADRVASMCLASWVGSVT